MIIVNTKNRNMPHPLHNSKINGKMNILSFQTLFIKYLNKTKILCLLLGLGFYCGSLTAQTFTNPQDTIDVIIPTNDNKGVVTGQQLHDALNPSDLLFFDNIDAVTAGGTLRDTTFIPDDNTHIFFVGCDTAVFRGDQTRKYGIDNQLDTLSDLMTVTFFSYFNLPNDARTDALRFGDTTLTAVSNPILSGSGASVTAVFRIIDNTPPVAMCMNGTIDTPTVVQLDVLGAITASQINMSSTDNCTADSLLTFSINPSTIQCDSINGNPFPVTVTITDLAGNSTSCIDTIIVVDALGPIIQNVPLDDTLTCLDVIPAQAVLTALDNCSPVPIPMDSIRTFMMSNRPDTSSTVTIDSLVRDSAFYNFDITYKWVATDTTGNVGDTAIQVIRVRDITPPTTTFTSPLLVPTSANATTCSANVTLDLAANVMDDCSADSLKYLAIADSNLVVIHDTLDIVNLNVPMGDTTVFIIAEDFSNNRDTFEILILVDDRTTPTPRCNNAVSITINAFGFAAIDSSVVNLNSVDNCTAANDLTFQLSRDTFTCSDIGQAVNIFMTVTDEAGNDAFCQSTITVLDFAGSGSFACPADVTIACDASTATSNTGEPTLLDVCGDNSSLTFNDNIIAGPGGTGNICQIIERTWIVTDTFGTVTTCTQFINLVDSIAPVLTQSFNDTIVACIGDAITSDVILATDNCVANAFVQAANVFTIGPDTIVLRKIWTASDSCSTTVDTQLIKIVDVLAPTITLPTDTFVFNTSTLAPDSCGIFVNIDFAQFVTDCNASLGLRVGHSGQDTTSILAQTFPVGEHPLTITARDSSGNIATSNILIDVNDTSTPTVVCVGNRTISLGTGGTGILQINDVFSSATDNCDGPLTIASATLSQSVFDCSDLGIQSVTLSVTDAAGNIGTCTVNVNVINGTGSSIISATASATAESFTGANDGTASVAVAGGSGNFTYAWSPGGGTTSTITNLAPGLYTVVVTDTGTGCTLTETVSVVSGATVIYTLGQAFGITGDTIQVPVTVTNFDSVAGFEMRFTINDTNVAQFINGNEAGGFNFPGLTSGAFQFQNVGVLDVTSLPTQGTTLADGTRIFYVNLVLLGNAGQTFDLSMIPLAVGATGIETTIIQNGVATAVNSTGGAITLTVGTMPPPPSTVTFGGNIFLEDNTPLEDVSVSLSGGATGVSVTNAAGNYQFSVAPTQSLTVTPAEDRMHNRGLTVTDLAIIQNHILGNTLLNSPYKMLAADVNGNERITVTDLAEIQSLILGIRTEFFTAPSWRFIPADFPISLPDPWVNPIPSSISNVSANADFIAVKLGDVNLSATTVTFRPDEIDASSRETFRFGIEDRLLKAGEIIQVPFKADNFTDMLAYQMTINADAEYLTFETVSAGALTNIDINNFGLNNAARGLISTLWYTPEPQNIEQNTTLFTISFRVNKGGKYLSDILRASSDLLSAEAFAEDETAKNISLTFDRNQAAEGFELFQNKPNPFGTSTTISFSLPKANAATLRFFDFSGRMVHQVKGAYDAGLNNVVIHKNELSGSGVLYYELATPTFTARKKMIVLD